MSEADLYGTGSLGAAGSGEKPRGGAPLALARPAPVPRPRCEPRGLAGHRVQSVSLSRRPPQESTKARPWLGPGGVRIQTTPPEIPADVDLSSLTSDDEVPSVEKSDKRSHLRHLDSSDDEEDASPAPAKTNSESEDLPKIPSAVPSASPAVRPPSGAVRDDDYGASQAKRSLMFGSANAGGSTAASRGGPRGLPSHGSDFG